MLKNKELTSLSELTKSEKRARLRLFRSENVGCVSFFQLLQRHGTAEEALNHINLYAQQGGRSKPLRLATDQEIDQEIQKTTRHGARFLFWGESLYPKELSAIYDPPPVIIYKGREELFQTPKLSIVGARNASLNAKKLAYTFSQKIAQEGWSIVSGLARGIDRAAHEGALDHATVACVAGGIDTIYPSENEDLFKAIPEKGLLMTEAPFGTKPHASLFPRRNRLVSGLSQGILVIEAALKSGSLITARLGLEHNREIFAIPGSPLDPRSQGANKLIQDGAKLVQKPEDILESLKTSPSLYPIQKNPMNHENLSEKISSKEMTRLRHLIITSLSCEPISVDELLRECDFSYSIVSYVLLELELAGRIIRHPGNNVSRKMDAV
tara:strand:- start:766 stop:1911 length:1146 start_codon:yes stop_codon:yes gene_type:complete